MNRLRKGFTLVELLVVIVIIGLLAGLLLPQVAKAIRRAEVAACSSNLKSLWQLQITYTIKYGGRYKQFPPETGSNFWGALLKVTPPLISQDEQEILWCPVKGGSQPGDIDFFGPALQVGRLNSSDPVGCDDPTNHSESGDEGGNVLRRGGDIVELQGSAWNEVLNSPKAPRR